MFNKKGLFGKSTINKRGLFGGGLIEILIWIVFIIIGLMGVYSLVQRLTGS